MHGLKDVSTHRQSDKHDEQIEKGSKMERQFIRSKEKRIKFTPSFFSEFPDVRFFSYSITLKWT